LAENKTLSDRVAELLDLLDQVENEEDQAVKEALATHVTNEADALTRQERVEFTPDEMVKIASANQLAGRLDIAEGHLKQALRSFRSESDLQGEAASLNNLGNIATSIGVLSVIMMGRDDVIEASSMRDQAVAIWDELGHPVPAWFSNAWS
jgi:methylphosphotriester-DNA--protein-cysteine methyltransferase